jgi:methylglutaconyl-CoA hydratase
VTGKTFFMGFANVINAMRKCPKFILVRVQGKAIGGGVGLAAAADYAMAHDSASIKLSELAVGIGPFVIGPVVERKMGLSAFSELAINATEWRTADWAKSRGLFHEVFDNVPQLDAYTTDLATRLSLFSLQAMQQLKKVLWENTEHWDELLQTRAMISGELILSDFSKQAIAKFKTKG